jgi:hypothetical protein
MYLHYFLYNFLINAFIMLMSFQSDVEAFAVYWNKFLIENDRSFILNE